MFLRSVVRVHKWIALIVGLQIAIWIAGGVVMSVIPIEQVRGEHKIAPQVPALVFPQDAIPVEEAAAGIGPIRSAELGDWFGRPVWRITDGNRAVFTVDARTGERLSPFGEEAARAVAAADYAGDVAIATAVLLDDPPAEAGADGPLWRVEFVDRDRTTIYVNPATGLVHARRSSTWRFYDFFWRLHIMDYNDGEDFNHPLLITAAGVAAIVALSGLILLVIKMRRTVLIALKSRAGARDRPI
ncbi:MAG: PepSY domain-containing protein [Maricaulaceae bacterium]|jgi:hypothetical protein